MALRREDIEHFIQFNSGAVATHIAYAQLIEAEKQTALLQEIACYIAREVGRLAKTEDERHAPEH